MREEPDLTILLKRYRNNLSELMFKRFQSLYYRPLSKVFKKSVDENAKKVFFYKGERIFESFGLYTKGKKTRMFGLGIYSPQEGDDLGVFDECDTYMCSDYDFEGAPLSVMLERDMKGSYPNPFLFVKEDGSSIVYVPVFSCSLAEKEKQAFINSYGEFMVDVDI